MRRIRFRSSVSGRTWPQIDNSPPRGKPLRYLFARPGTGLPNRQTSKCVSRAWSAILLGVDRPAPERPGGIIANPFAASVLTGLEISGRVFRKTREELRRNLRCGNIPSVYGLRIPGRARAPRGLWRTRPVSRCEPGAAVPEQFSWPTLALRPPNGLRARRDSRRQSAGLFARPSGLRCKTFPRRAIRRPSAAGGMSLQSPETARPWRSSEQTRRPRRRCECLQQARDSFPRPRLLRLQRQSRAGAWYARSAPFFAPRAGAARARRSRH